VEPEELLADYRARVAGIAERAQAARARIATVRGTATSSDGAVTVSVNVQGALEDLSFGPGADSLALSELAATILRTSRKARVRAATAGADALVPLIGTDSAAMNLVRANIPDGTPLDEVADRPGRDGLNEEESERARDASAAAAPSPIARPRPHLVDDDLGDFADDEDGTGFTRGD
jgi:hypothetical protein